MEYKYSDCFPLSLTSDYTFLWELYHFSRATPCHFPYETIYCSMLNMIIVISYPIIHGKVSENQLTKQTYVTEPL